MVEHRTIPNMRGKVHWYYDSLTPRAAVFHLVVEQALEEVFEELAEQVEEYAKANAPWEDRSGGARDGLTAEYIDGGLFQHAIVLYHTVEYGIWLEVRWNGKFAIIIPTIEAMGPQVMAGLSGLIGSGM